RSAELLRDQPGGHSVDEAPLRAAPHASQASSRLWQAMRGSGRGHPHHRRSAWTRVFGVDQGLHAGVVPAHPADRRVIWLPRGLKYPMNIGEKIQLLHEGRNFQKELM